MAKKKRIRRTNSVEAMPEYKPTLNVSHKELKGKVLEVGGKFKGTLHGKVTGQSINQRDGKTQTDYTIEIHKLNSLVNKLKKKLG